METKGVKLKSLSEYIDDIERFMSIDEDDMIDGYHRIVDFKNFGKLILELWMFVPCDKDGLPLERPDPNTYSGYHETINNEWFWNDQHEFDCYTKDLKKFEKAQLKCIFIGVSLGDAKIYASSKWTVEYLVGKTLTSSKAQHLGLIK